MPRQNLHESVRKTYIRHMFTRNGIILADADTNDSSSDSDSDSSSSSDDSMLDRDELQMIDMLDQLQMDLDALEKIRTTRYLRPRPPVIKCGQLTLLLNYGMNPADHERFVNMVRVSPFVFRALLDLIEDDTIFTNNSHNPQESVEVQLAVTLYRLGRYGNGASLEDIARMAGISEGSVEMYTERCFTAIERLHNIFVRPLTDEEKEVEKKWMETHLGFSGLWREGYLMYDGTIVVLYEKPGLNGNAYYTRKANYGLNAQIGNTPSNLRIVDYSHGPTGSAHDAFAFEFTAAHKYPNHLFKGEEFAWGDSAYRVTPKMISVHKRPAADLPDNRLFDKYLSRIRVRSEHCMGALKGRWQCLRGLRVNISSNETHIKACRWITICIILHNAVIDLEGSASGAQFVPMANEEAAAAGPRTGSNEDDDYDGDEDEAGEAKRKHLVAEIVYVKQGRQ